jgi:acyl-CoA thioester hydrolase
MTVMARIKITPSGKTVGKVQIAIRITDINYGNHLGNDALVSILHEARVQWLQSLHYGELNIEGIGLIMSDLAVEYKREGLYGDILDITISAAEVSRVGFELYYSVSNQRNEIIAIARTGMVCYDYGNKKVAAIPAAFRAALLPDQ